MTAPARFRAAWIALAAIGVAIIAFGIITSIAPPAGDRALWRADSLATVGTGLFGLLITLFAFRRHQPWAWWSLWFYPAYWLTHLLANLPPAKDHIHQYLYLVISMAALLAAIPEFTSAGRAEAGR